MSSPVHRHRGAIVRAAATLFRRNGFAATGINEIAEVSGAPKGSLYHYFPDGKDQIAEAAIRFAGAGLVATLEKLEQEHDTASVDDPRLLQVAGRLDGQVGLSRRLPDLDHAAGVGAAIRALTAAGREAFDSWRAVIARALVRDGFGKAEAKRLATLTVSAIEGSLILARVEGSSAPIDDVAKSLASALQVR